MSAFSTFLLLFLLVIPSYGALALDRQREKCSIAVKSWALQAVNELSELAEDHHKQLKELLYFLHVPRTGGRTYHQCLLRHLYPKQQHCDRSYDKLRFNSSDHCKLLVNHDDYSILTKLPAESTSIVTNIRHPVDRVFSAYEFSVEVAARFFARNLRIKPKTQVTAAKTSKSTGSSTLSIWPWSHLVPWMRDDLFEREKLRLSGGADPLPLGFSNYDASSFVMPLHEFIHQPMVVDIVHNGATFQVTGLTNNSYIKEAGKIRNCVIDYPDLGLHILNVAKMRIDKMIFVGLTEKHEESAKLFAHIVGGQILPLGQPIDIASRNDVPTQTDSALSDAGMLAPNSSTSEVPDSQILPPPLEENLTVYGLIEKYEKCAGRFKNTQRQRRTVSLKNALPVNFSDEARREVLEDVLDEIRRMNALDLELYAYAQQRFKSQVLVQKSGVSRQFGSEHSMIWDTDTNINEGFQQAIGSSSWIFVSMLFMAGGVVTMAASLMVFANGKKIFKFQKGQNRGAMHEKL
ncbi:hypothetical protein GOP47_0011320 [Adiantum capillus-veneris]|uniref:Uncharacterized protein n=1 Tax=Adiantum capillus-veneris TaxID=13818 RepID=A0A9D4UT00_ADICA|nr:hypothetical protein GOP47_0011320 [Adiantum capillus-veneris]